jgi:subtilisin family serine protease
VLRAVTELAQHPDVVYAEPNYVLHVDLEPLPDVPLIPSDPFVSRDGSHWSEASWGQAYPDLWGIRRARTVEGWNVFDEDGSGAFESAEGRPGEGIVVAVIDSGLDRHHPEIAQNVWRNPGEIPDNGIDDDDNGYVDDVWGWDFANGDADPSDGHGHGTHVAGTIAARTDDGFGPIKGLSDSGHGTLAGLASAVRYAADMGADVISNSWGGSGFSATLEAAFDYAAALGAIPVASAGNSNVDAASAQPAGFESVMAVAALGPDDTKAFFSNFGDTIEISAPGLDVLSLNANGGANVIAVARPDLVVSSDHLRLSGTSMACPRVSGALAVLLSRYPDDPPAEIRGRLRAGAEPVDAANPDFAGRLGSGRLDLEQALVIAPRPLIDLTGVETGRLFPGEEAPLSIRLVNRWQGVGPVTAVLRAGSGLSSVLEGVAALGDLPAGETVGNGDEPFRISLDASTPIGEDIPFALELLTPGGLVTTIDFAVRVTLFHDLGDRPGLPLRNFLSWRASFRDLDGDGLKDAQWVAFDGLSLLRNAGDGRFDDVTFQSGVFSPLFGTSQPLAIDVDNDGDLDLFVAGFNLEYGSRFFENRGGGSFVDRTDDSVRGVRAFVAAAFDFDGDGFVDIVGGAQPDLRDGIAHPGGLFLLRNEGGESFTNAIEGTCLPASQWLTNGQIATFDYDDDGDLDLLARGSTATRETEPSSTSPSPQGSRPTGIRKRRADPTEPIGMDAVAIRAPPSGSQRATTTTTGTSTSS